MNEVEHVCSKCDRQSDLMHENGLCPDCETLRRDEVLKEHLEERGMVELLDGSATQPGYASWACHVIPEVCPYCKEEIKKEKVRGKPYYLHFCHSCKVYFGHEEQ